MIRIKRIGNFFFRHPQAVKQDIHTYFINIVLNYYENWVLPKQKISLRELKIKEFEDRKKILHPYSKDSFIAENINDDKIVRLQNKVRMSNMHTFTLTYNRHDGMYEYKLSNFPDTYRNKEAFYDMIKDPDWIYKMKYTRARGKLHLFIFLSIVALFLYLNKRATKFDADFRRQTRQQMNKGAKEMIGKKYKYSFFDQSNNIITDFGYNYTVLWYDARVKNYLGLVSTLPTKHLATNRIVPVLLVDKIEHMAKVYNVEKQAISRPKVPDRNARLGLIPDYSNDQKQQEFKTKVKQGFDIRVLRVQDEEDKSEVNRTLTEKIERQQLQSAFGINQDDSVEELKLEKNHYYVLDENNVIIDAAKIYNFDHEDSIYQRIATKINKDIEEKRTSV